MSFDEARTHSAATVETAAARKGSGRWVVIATLVLSMSTVALAACRSSKTPQELALEGTERLTDVIERVVSDAERAALARTVVTGYLDDERAFFMGLRANHRALVELNADPEASRAHFDELTGRVNVSRREFQRRTVIALTELKAQLDPPEWEAVFAEMKANDEKWEALR